jgi:hypothetical protein
MINVKFDNQLFNKEMKNITNYAIGFVDGARVAARTELVHQIGIKTKEILGLYIDASARISPDVLHHVYEWYQTGSPEARLFNLDYRVVSSSLSLDATFTQSTSIKNGSKTPFYNKASIMERGISLRITPRNSEVLVFEDGGKEVFTKNPVEVDNPGGSQVAGVFEKIFLEFFNRYFSQSFMKISGLDQKIKNSSSFVSNIKKAKSGGRSFGYNIGYRWIVGKAGA